MNYPVSGIAISNRKWTNTTSKHTKITSSCDKCYKGKQQSSMRDNKRKSF